MGTTFYVIPFLKVPLFTSLKFYQAVVKYVLIIICEKVTAIWAK
jgi:hypothetical protein